MFWRIGVRTWAGQWAGFSSGRSAAGLFLAIRPRAPCHHVHLTDDQAVAHLQRRLDHDAAAVRVFAPFSKRRPPLVRDLSIDAVRGLLCVDRLKVLGYPRLPAKLYSPGSENRGLPPNASSSSARRQ